MNIDQLNEALQRGGIFWLLFIIAVLLLLIYSKVSSQKKK